MEEDARTGNAWPPATGIVKEPDRDWLISIMQGDDPKARSKHRIEKVPARFLGEKRNKYFIPQVVSLGPYHHGKPHLKAMEKQKITTARRFILYNESKTSLQEKTQVKENLFKEVMNVRGEARKFYAAEKDPKLSDEAFTRMMFLDGCFVLYFIHCMSRRNIKLEVSNRLIPLIVRDMFLLENQLPFVVLDALMGGRLDPNNWRSDPNNWRSDSNTEKKNDSNTKLKGKIMKFIQWKVLLPMGLSCFTTRRCFTGGRDDDPLHLLDFLRIMLLDSPPSEPEENYRYRLNNFGSFIDLKEADEKFGLHNYDSVMDFKEADEKYGLHNFGSVMELKEAGIRFEKSDSGYLTDILFKEYFFFPRLLLPSIVINDVTISQLMNLTVFEMCSDIHSGCGITSYISFLDSLINHGADVKELRSKGILHHALGSDEEVALLFNEWPIEGMNDLYVYFEVKGRIYSHLHSSVKVSIARVLHTYFKSPWTAISFVAAVLLLFFTAIQTGLAVFPRH